MLEIWSGVDCIYIIIAVVFCVVNIVTVPRAFHTVWNWAVCGARSFVSKKLFSCELSPIVSNSPTTLGMTRRNLRRICSG